MRHASLHPGSEGSPIREVGAPKSPNRLLNFSRTEVVASIEKTPSPFKGRTGMGEKRKGPRKSIFEFNLSPEKRTNNVRPEQQEQRPDTVNQTVADDVDDRTAQDAEDSLPGATNEDLTAPDMDNSVGVIQAPDVDESTVSSHQQNASTHRGRGRPRKSDISVASNSGTPVTASRKRKSMEGANDSMISNPDEQVQSSPAQLAIKALRQAQQEDPPATGDTFVPQMDDQPGNSTNEDRHTTIDAEQTETRESTISAEPPIEEEPEEEEAPPPKKRSKRGARLSSKRKQAAPSQRAREKSHQPSAYRPSESADPDGNGRRGPKSLVSLRAGTPLEDSGRNVTRSGRVSVKPLKYWCNETFIWRNGEVDGIVRAEEVEEPKKKPMRKGGRRRGGSRLGSVPEEEEEDDEDLLPEKWEEELGVINGRVRSWDAELGAGSVEEEVDEGEFLSNLSGTTTRADRELTGKKKRRRRLRVLEHRRPRRARLSLQVRQSHDSPLLRQRHGRDPTGRLQTHKEFAQDADGLLRARGQSHCRGGWPYIWLDKRRCLAGPQGYVIFRFLPLSVPPSLPHPHCAPICERVEMRIFPRKSRERAVNLAVKASTTQTTPRGARDPRVTGLGPRSTNVGTTAVGLRSSHRFSWVSRRGLGGGTWSPAPRNVTRQHTPWDGIPTRVDGCILDDVERRYEPICLLFPVAVGHEITWLLLSVVDVCVD